MLSTEEVRLLHWLTSQQYTGRGEIIDAGCFLGGSSVAFADGLKRNKKLEHSQKHKRITSYDLFIADWYANKYFLPDKQEGEDFSEVFLQRIKPYEDYITTMKGDIRLIEWRNRPIEILFIDVAKQPDINDILIQRLFPYLLPRVSFVIQQDYIHEWLPWIHITMEHFAEYFTLRDSVWEGSAVYQLSESIPADKCLRFSIKDILPDDQVKLMDQALDKTPLPKRKVVTLAKARLLYDIGRIQKAHKILDTLSQQKQNEPRVTQGINDMRNFISRIGI
jgi:hypothetical protein